MSELKAGLYRHYKGNTYQVIGLVRHSESLDKLVLYKALYGEQELWVRPLEMFQDTVVHEGQRIPRFTYQGQKKYTTLLFDLDGTLTDSAPGITNSVRYALDRFGIMEKDDFKLRRFIGPPLIDSFQSFYGFSPEQARQAVAYYREYFAERGLYENAVYPGIPELLAELQQKGKRLILATSKPTVFSERILEYFDLKKYFSLVVGSNLDGTRITKKEVIQYILGSLAETQRDECIMIGDREHDCIGARECGIDCIAVLYGYGSLEELSAQKPAYLAGSVAELSLLLGNM